MIHAGARPSLAVLLLAASCSGPPSGLALDAPVLLDAAAVPDAAIDAEPATLGPALVFDDLHIASITEDAHAFSVLGAALNAQLQSAVQAGQLLLGIELRGLDDPSGQADGELTVGLYWLTDSDGDAADNFDPDLPEIFRPLGLVGGEPVMHFTTASIAGGQLAAEGADELVLPLGGLQFPIRQLSLSGRLRPTDDDLAVHRLDDGRLRGAVPASLLYLAPNITSGTCPGSTMLDVLIGGCGYPLSLQPDVDLDGDGLERFYDQAGGGDAGTTGDGRVDRCVDGDGTEVLGESCPSGAGFADGYRLIFVVTGVRAILLAP